MANTMGPNQKVIGIPDLDLVGSLAILTGEVNLCHSEEHYPRDPEHDNCGQCSLPTALWTFS